ncbi:dehydrogenase [Capsulimonas corticalis]|uniref:Dehydrogenase n=1 Tax=Capsulimonas corticalis TaxID=2219043 RepID=A0A402CUM5_9BACT|nr:Gfo/Idh/MocA family oxidoreductase [Capsulimonas corticalis]BDI29014.1 dehydrogenase [Capsulimonas corticalis]
MTYRVALIGAGNMGGWHANQWKHVEGAELVGVLDPRQEAAHAHGPVFSDWDTLLSKAKPDIIDICTPTPVHREYVELAAAAGKAIFVEKPLSRSIEDCEAIIKAVEKAGVPAMAGHVVRYFPEYAAAKRIVDEGGVGKPATVRTARMSGFPTITGRENWYANAEKSGGVVLDMILHDFDWLRWTFGPVTRVMAKGLFGTGRFDERLDYALVTLRFESGVVGHVTGSWAHPSGFQTTYEVAGDKGLISHDSNKSVSLSSNLRSKDGAGAGVTVPESPMFVTDDPYYKELNAFVQALRAGVTPPVTVYDALEAARIALAALESIETGKAVTL